MRRVIIKTHTEVSEGLPEPKGRIGDPCSKTTHSAKEDAAVQNGLVAEKLGSRRLRSGEISRPYPRTAFSVLSRLYNTAKSKGEKRYPDLKASLLVPSALLAATAYVQAQSSAFDWTNRDFLEELVKFASMAPETLNVDTELVQICMLPEGTIGPDIKVKEYYQHDPAIKFDLNNFVDASEGYWTISEFLKRQKVVKIYSIPQHQIINSSLEKNDHLVGADIMNCVKQLHFVKDDHPRVLVQPGDWGGLTE